GAGSNIGILLTSYNFIEKHNQLGGVDGRFKISKQKTFSFQVLGTISRKCFNAPALDTHRPGPSDGCFVGYSATAADPFRPAETRNYYRTGKGLAYRYEYNRDGRHFYYGFNGNGQSPDYFADVGFTRRQNTNFAGGYLGYSSEPKPKARMISWSLNANTGGNFSWQGLSQNAYEEVSVSANFQKSTYLGIGHSVSYERLFEEEFGLKRTATHGGAFFGRPERSAYQFNPYIYGGGRPSKKYAYNFFLQRGQNNFDFDFGAGPKYPRVSPAALADLTAPLDPGPGAFFSLDLSGEYKPTNELAMSLSYSKSSLKRNDTHLVAFEDNIYSFRSTYQFTRFVFLRARVDYDTLASSARGQFLFGYTPNPGTAFYLGYNDDLTRNGFNPFTGQLEPGFRRNGRTFFIKMSYLFRRSFGK
ncbi:MAG TPA: hypothetical protein VK475_05010, partial [Pyrinomonadaceae bacterium]|nr:hypothetical protein [Pyrinomonadaceae bacterium]